MKDIAPGFTAFVGERIIASGPLGGVALAVKAALDEARDLPVLVFDDTSGSVVDLDLRGNEAEVLARIEGPRGDRAAAGAGEMDQSAPSRRGRPRLGVVAREVTLLPRHWQWLAGQPGGASNALRRLTEAAMRADLRDGASLRARREAAYRFMSAMGGNLPGFEEAIRALFAGDRNRFATHVETWPADIRAYAGRMAWEDPPLAPGGA